VRYDTAEIRRRLADPIEVARLVRIEDGAKRQSRGLMVRCPNHNERTASCSVRIASDGTIWCHCHGCGWAGDVIDLIGKVHGAPGKGDAIRIAAGLAGVDGASGVAPPAPPRPALPPPAPRFPPDAEAFYAACLPVSDAIPLRAQLRARGIDHATVTDRGLARALPPTGTLPDYARFRGKSWRDLGYDLIIPTYNSAGRLVSCRARTLGAVAEDGFKSLAPAGFNVGGAVMADPLGRQILAGADLGWWKARTLLIAEGEPDFLTLATWYGDDESAPAVLGVVSGSWTQAIADRIPDGTQVVIRTHMDEAGNRYADEIGVTLADRCPLFRPAPDGAEGVR
jgi:hypothetical protein